MTYSSSRSLLSGRRARTGAHILVLSLATAALLTTGCKDDDPVQPPGHVHTVATMTVTPSVISLHMTEQATMNASARCGCGSPVDASVQWSTDNAAVATVNSSGVVTATGLGAAQISATAEGKTASAAVMVNPMGTVIGPAGGVVVSSDGVVELQVPAGALATMTDVAIQPVAPGTFAGDPLYVAGTGYVVTPAQAQLQVAARLRIRFDAGTLPAGVFAQQLRIRERDQDQWRETQQHQLLANQVEAHTLRLGTFAIVIQPASGTMVGPGGGTVTSADGNVELVIPANALTTPADVQVLAVPATMFAADPLYVPGTGYQLLPDGLALQQRAQLRIRFNPALLPPGVFPEQLRLRERDRQHNAWQATLQHQLLAQRVQGELSQFGIFAIVVQPAAGTIIGPTGGVAMSADGNAELVVPPGALAAATDIVIEPADASVLGADPLYIPGTGYEVGPAGIQFQERAQLRIRYNPAALPPGVFAEQLRLRERDRQHGQWLGTQDHFLMAQRVEGSIQGAGTFGLLVQPALGTMIGPAGGLAVSDDGNAELVIPPGAVLVATDIQVVPVADAVFGGDPTAISGTGYEVRPAGLILRTRAQLRVRYDPSRLPVGVTPEQLRLRERDRVMNQWRETQQHMLLTQRVQAGIDWFGTFAIVAIPADGTIVGPLGGIVVSADGFVSLVIPAGALAQPVEVKIEKADESMLARVVSRAAMMDPSRASARLATSAANGNGTSDVFVPGTAYEIRPAGHALLAQAQLRIHYLAANLPAGAEPQHLRIRERDRVQNRWRDPSLCTTGQDDVVTSIGAFGFYGIVASMPKPQVPGSVKVLPEGAAVEEGDVLQMTAIVYDTDGNVMYQTGAAPFMPIPTPSLTVTWTSSNPSIATVDANGLLKATGTGVVTITASAGGVQGQAAVTTSKKAASVTVVPATASVAVAGSVQLNAEVRDAQGNLITKSVTWTSSSTAIATVSSGLVTGVSIGTVTITARVQNVAGTATVTVTPPVASVVIAAVGNEPLEVGLTRQLTATAYDASGQPVTVQLTWASSDNNIATVDNTGLVTGVSSGTVNISASVGSVSDAVSIKVVGESTEEAGNNLSVPVVFADGIGITGQPVATDPGVRPLITDTITVTGLPFFWTGNVPTYGVYYEQQTFNTWRPEIVDGTGQGAYSAQIDWGDNLVSQTWSASRPIRVEQGLYATGLSLLGFNMTYLYGTGPDEMQGTDGTTSAFTPLIYTAGATLVVEKLSSQGGSPVATVVDEVAGSEVNVGGKIIYGYNLRLDQWTAPAGITKDGWYRITFKLATGANLNITSLADVSGTYLPTFTSRASSIEIYVKP